MTKDMRIASLIAVVLGCAGLVQLAFAHTEGACKDDVKKLCGDLKPGDGKIRDCMKAHESELSQACKDNMAEMKQKHEQMRKEIEEACKADVKQFCANVTPGAGREMACLRSYEDKLSAGCKAKLPKGMMGKHKEMDHPAPPPAGQ